MNFFQLMGCLEDIILSLREEINGSTENFQNSCICCADSVVWEAVRTKCEWGLCPISAQCTVDFDMVTLQVSHLSAPSSCPFRRILWHQDLWSQAHKHHPGLISEGFMRLGQPRLRPGSDHHPSSFVCSFVFCLFVSVGYYGYLYLFQVLVSFSCGCPSSLRVIFPVIVPTSLRVSCTEESMVRKWIFRLILLLPPSRAWFFHLFPNLLKETRLWN